MSGYNENDLGSVAEFCPVCHGVTEHRLLKISESSLFGEDEVLGWFVVCQVCDTYHSGNPSLYEEPVERFDTLEELIETSFPDLGLVYAERLEFERKLREDPDKLDKEERKTFIREALESFVENYDVDDRDYTGWRYILWAPIYGMFAAFGTLIIAPKTSSIVDAIDSRYTWGLIFFLLFLGGFSYGLYGLFTEENPFELNYPLLVDRLAPVQPSVEELEEEVIRLQKLGVNIPSSLDPEQLVEDLEPSEIKSDVLLNVPEPNEEDDRTIEGFGAASLED